MDQNYLQENYWLKWVYSMPRKFVNLSCISNVLMKKNVRLFLFFSYYFTLIVQDIELY